MTVTLKLKKIYSPYLNQKIIEFNNYKQFYSVSNNIDNHEYSVSWISNFTKEKIQGLNYLSKHSKIKNNNLVFFRNKKIGLINLFISKLIVKNRCFSRIIHFIYRNYKKYFYNKLCNIDEIFYPQDYFIDWNKIYERKGFFQVQFIIPKNKFRKILAEISNFFEKEKIFSPFIVVKRYDEKGKYLNFCGSGYSISFDFEINKNFKILKLFLNSLIKNYKLRVNFSKDLVVNKTNASNYSEFKIFKKEILLLNPQKKINSFFSKRLEI